jgi:dolichyldiphosphatase
MAYFTSFLLCHLYSRHRFSTTGYPALDFLFRMTAYAVLLTWTGTVAYSRCENISLSCEDVNYVLVNRYYLGYHNANQIFWGLAIGASLGISLYLFVEAIPNKYPTSRLGKAKIMLLNNSIAVWLQIRDGWNVWADGGRETEWLRWREEWKRRQGLKVEKRR